MKKQLKAILAKRITPVYLIGILVVVMGVPTGIATLMSNDETAWAGGFALIAAGIGAVAFIIDRILALFVNHRVLFGVEILLLGSLFLLQKSNNRLIRIKSEGELSFFMVISGICESSESKVEKAAWFNQSITLSKGEQEIYLTQEKKYKYNIEVAVSNWEDYTISGIRDTIAGKVYEIELYKPYGAATGINEPFLFDTVREKIRVRSCNR